MNFFNDVEKIVYRKKTEDPVILLEYIKFTDEKRKEKYILFKLKNNVAQSLKNVDIEVTQYDYNDHKIGKIVFNYANFVAKGYEVFVPTAKLLVQYDTAYIEVKILGAKFETFVYSNDEYNAIPFKAADFEKNYVNKNKTTKKENKVRSSKVRGIRKTKFKDVTKRNRVRGPKVVAAILVLAFIAVSVYAAIITRNSTKTFSDDNFTYEIIDSKNIAITDYIGTDTDVVVPAKYKKYNISAIGAQAFAETEVERVYFRGESVIIYKNAFYSCLFLQEVIDETNCVTDIASNAFSYCINLNTAVFRDATVSTKAFDYCNSLTYLAYGKINAQSLDKLFSTGIPASLRTVEVKSGDITTGYFGVTNCKITTLILNGDVVVNQGALSNVSLGYIKIGKDAMVVPKALKGQRTTLQIVLHKENSFGVEQYSNYSRFISTYSD